MSNVHKPNPLPVEKREQVTKVFPHAMLREIYEQPLAIQQTVESNLDDDLIFPTALRQMEGTVVANAKIIIAASGSSRHAGLAGEIMMEDLSGVAVDVEYSSEYCYRSTHAGSNPVVLVITQSGETADTLAAQREALHRGARTVAISNVADSTIVREAKAALHTSAGIETAIPATKSFTAQLATLFLFALFLARKHGRMTSGVIRAHLDRLREIPATLERCLPEWDSLTARLAHQHQHGKTFLFLGRGVHYAIAREGALKLKEVSYVQAEGLPTGELRHGPNAAVDENLTVIILATHDKTDPDSLLRYQKTLSMIEYVQGRGAKTIVIASLGDTEVAKLCQQVIYIPAVPELLAPLLEVVPLQLFAYHFAVLNGLNVDRPRNLVKSVTTE